MEPDHQTKKAVPLFFANVSHHAKINKSKLSVLCLQEVTSMRIGVEKTYERQMVSIEIKQCSYRHIVNVNISTYQ